MTLITLTQCKNQEATLQNQNEIIKQEETKKEDTKIDDDLIIDNDEIIDFDDEDNLPPKNERVVVEKVINCDGCVFAYFSDEGDKAKTLGSTLLESEYSTDISNLKTMGGKQRHNFFVQYYLIIQLLEHMHVS